MKPPEEIRREFVLQWIHTADEDLAAAGHLLCLEPPLLRSVGFHAQQSTEKYLKAYLAWRQIDFPKTHNIANLLDLLSDIEKLLATALIKTEALTEYAVTIRYPGDQPEISYQKASQAVALAEETKRQILDALRNASFPE